MIVNSYRPSNKFRGVVFGGHRGQNLAGLKGQNERTGQQQTDPRGQQGMTQTGPTILYF